MFYECQEHASPNHAPCRTRKLVAYKNQFQTQNMRNSHFGGSMKKWESPIFEEYKHFRRLLKCEGALVHKNPMKKTNPRFRSSRFILIWPKRLPFVYRSRVIFPKSLPLHLMYSPVSIICKSYLVRLSDLLEVGAGPDGASASSASTSGRAPWAIRCGRPSPDWRSVRPLRVR